MEVFEYDNIGAATYFNGEAESTKAFLMQNNIKGLVVSYDKGYQAADVAFLKEFDFLEILTIQFYGNIDISAIHYLTHLKRLTLNIIANDRQPIDFSCFPHLEIAKFPWRPKAKSLFDCKTLKHLRLEKFGKEDLTDLVKLTRLEFLEIASSPIKSTKGIEKLNLRELGLYYLTKLESLEGLGGLAPTLKEMELQACKRIMDIDEIGKLFNLEKLGVNNCGDIDSIKPIRELKKLKDFRFWESTNVIDGDMSPCIGVNTVAFKSRPHYTHTRQQIDEINSK